MKGLLQRLAARLGRHELNAGGDQLARRVILGGLSLDKNQRREPMRLWRVALWPILALVLYRFESGLLLWVGPEVVRVDVAVLFLTFAALHLGAMEGALAAFAIGYVADLFIQGPPGLCRLLAVATWTVVRVASARVSLPGWFASLMYTAGAAAAFQAGLLGGFSLAAGDGSAPGTIAWLSLVPQSILTAAFAVPVHAALSRLDHLTSRREPAR